ncbi:unnamed protein product [Sympodiomycopsis kandeliae]
MLPRSTTTACQSGTNWLTRAGPSSYPPLIRCASSASARRADNLSSAAAASRWQSDQQAPPQPVNPESWSRLTSDGELMPDPDSDQIDDGLTSQARRLSPIGRLSRWQPGGAFTFPSEFNNSALTAINDGNKTLLKTDLRKSLAGELNVSSGVSRSRLSLLHLAATSPSRFASIRQVLSTAAQRFSNLPGDSTWSPSRIEEHGCGVGEGAWAAAETWPGTLREWRGIDNRGHLLRQGRELAKHARGSQTPGNLAGVDLVSFGTNRKDDKDPLQAERTPISPQDTLSLSAFNLLALGSDSAREQHVKQLWKHRSEAIVLIEEGTDRGFAAIASARALLLELGKEDQEKAESMVTSKIEAGEFNEAGREKIVIDGVEYFEELPEDQEASESEQGVEDESSGLDTATRKAQMSRGCHVVAPCPHDRPCPLLHPFKQDDSFYTPFNAPARPQEPSVHHHGSHLGMSTCVHPVRYMPPAWARDALAEQRRRRKEKGGREHRSTRFAYVVVKRGPRPDIHSPQLQSKDVTVDQVKAAAPEARAGILDLLRKGEPVGNRRIPEDVLGFSDEIEASERVRRAEEEERLDQEARDQLMRLLPAELQRAAADSGADGEQEEEALRQVTEMLMREQEGQASGVDAEGSTAGTQSGSSPESVWQASADIEGDAAAGQEAEATSVDEDTNPEWLSDMLRGNLPSEKDGQEVDSKATSSSEAISSAITHLLPSLPRILLPPMKKGGHVTFDACHSNGSIQRYTIARSSGKQPYQEVRKASWSDTWGQDPIEGQDSDLITTDSSGKKRWIKRRGWGQWSRINRACTRETLSENATAKATKKGYQSNRLASNKASNRLSALIGVDQVCPPKEYSPQATSTDKKKPRSTFTVVNNSSKSGGYGLTNNAQYSQPKFHKKVSDKKYRDMKEIQKRMNSGLFWDDIVPPGQEELEEQELREEEEELERLKQEHRQLKRQQQLQAQAQAQENVMMSKKQTTTEVKTKPTTEVKTKTRGRKIRR